ncbi:hypothetical protein [uncultured Phyllobacterium sp.]|uniref:hypothetical protein n=1 Tax=uncultured Phyllobacterium sp. TaxID=253813 RepID=UPI00258C7FFB|nr:hypothetical protein [uncultured Phyllobacterium sp.]
MKPRFFPLLPLLFLTACSDTEQPDPSVVSASTFDAAQFDELKSQIARLADQNSDFAKRFGDFENSRQEIRVGSAGDVAEMKRLQDELDHLKTAQAIRLQPVAEVCQ